MDFLTGTEQLDTRHKKDFLFNIFYFDLIQIMFQLSD